MPAGEREITEIPSRPTTDTVREVWERAHERRADDPDGAITLARTFERSIDIETYDRHAEKLREELTLARIDRHSSQLEEIDRTPQTFGCRPHSISGSGSNNCSFPTELRSTEIALFEPA